MMHAADIIVTKAGPGTITEAMACGLPIILTGAVPGQEEGNVAFVVEHDLGVLARSPASVVSALRGLLEPDSPRLEELRANVRRMSRPGAAFDIAKLIFDRLPPPGAPAVWPRVRRPRAARLAAASGSRVGAAPLGHRGLRPLSPRVRAVSVPMSRLALTDASPAWTRRRRAEPASPPRSRTSYHPTPQPTAAPGGPGERAIVTAEGDSTWQTSIMAARRSSRAS